MSTYNQKTLLHVQYQLNDLAFQLKSKRCRVYTAPNPYTQTMTVLIAIKDNKHIAISYNLSSPKCYDYFAIYKYIPRSDEIPNYEPHVERLATIYSDDLDISADQLIDMMAETPPRCNNFYWLIELLYGGYDIPPGEPPRPIYMTQLTDDIKLYFAPLVTVKNLIKRVIKSIFG